MCINSIKELQTETEIPVPCAYIYLSSKTVADVDHSMPETAGGPAGILHTYAARPTTSSTITSSEATHAVPPTHPISRPSTSHLVFRTPPTASSLLPSGQARVEILELEEGVPANAVILSQELALRTEIARANEEDRAGLADELDVIELHKAEEWEEQRLTLVGTNPVSRSLRSTDSSSLVCILAPTTQFIQPINHDIDSTLPENVRHSRS